MVAISIDGTSDVPPYEQVRTQIARQASSGELEAGTRLPTVRGLAGELGLAVNTVARAFRELEADGVITTRGRQGSFISSAAEADAGDTGAVETAASTYAATARAHGRTLAEATRALERAWVRH